MRTGRGAGQEWRDVNLDVPGADALLRARPDWPRDEACAMTHYQWETAGVSKV